MQHFRRTATIGMLIGGTTLGLTWPTATAAQVQETPAAAPAPKEGIQYNGLIDGYYQFQLTNPRRADAITGRVYDVRHNAPTLNLAELNVFQNAKPGGFGFRATLIAGDTADLNHGSLVGQDAGGRFVLVRNDRGEGRYKNVQQLYGTYAFGGKGGGVDVGKFYTPIGYEVTESNGNNNYSRYFAFSYQPFYHAGVRIYTPVPGADGLTATAYLVNAVFNTNQAGVQNDSGRPGFVGQLTYTPPGGRFTVNSTLGLGKEKPYSTVTAPGGPSTQVTASDTYVTYTFSPTTTGGLDFYYRRFRPDGGNKQTTTAYTAYFRQSLTPRTAYALRLSSIEDKTDTVGTFRPSEITATYEVKSAANFTTRFEYRHDHANTGFYLDSHGSATRKDQDALTMAGIVTF